MEAFQGNYEYHELILCQIRNILKIVSILLLRKNCLNDYGFERWRNKNNFSTVISRSFAYGLVSADWYDLGVGHLFDMAEMLL